MSRIISAIALFFIPFFAHAQEDAAAAVTPLPAEADYTAMIVFTLLLVGSTIWFGWFIWKKEKERKERESAAK
jgi:predicted negative regulator of RcsB-dependent stress response